MLVRARIRTIYGDGGWGDPLDLDYFQGKLRDGLRITLTTRYPDPRVPNPDPDMILTRVEVELSDADGKFREDRVRDADGNLG